jgi:uracil-DNA glycosylase
MLTYENIIKNINSEWIVFFENNKDELKYIIEQLKDEIYYPLDENIFKSLKYMSVKDIKLVILGQDPYINKDQATGLAFSVSKHCKIPPSLKNIFKEIKNNYSNYEIPNNGCLERWSEKEHILLLNCILTVKPGKSNSHKKLWINFTNKLIQFINDYNDNTIFLLMGNFAINKSNLIDCNKHKIFTTSHPSPLSANKGFLGSNIFKLINNYLEETNKKIINF